MDLAPVEETIRAELPPVRQMKELVPALTILTHEDFEFAGGLLTKVKGEFNRIEATRTGITKPMLEAKRRVDELFRPVLSAWGEVEASLKGKLSAYAAKIESERVAAMASPTRDLIVAPPVAAGIAMRTVRRWRYGPQGEDGVPRDWCSPDPVKIQAYLDAGGRVPGVEIYDETIVAARGA